MKIKTNNQSRQLINFEDLTEKEKLDFDWVGFEFGQVDFVRYKGLVFCLEEFCLCSDNELSARGWQGIEGQSAFHAVVVKYDQYDRDYVVMGSVFS
jgi:hypothetical protein